MRLAVISDVHGNWDAFEAVLADIDRQHVDLVVDLGDLLSGGLEPARTADRMMTLDHMVIRGNHERQLLESPCESLGSSDRFAAQQLDQRHLDWLATLPQTVAPMPGVLAIHGSPQSDLEYLLETVTPSGARAATPDEIAQRMHGIGAISLLLCGHTHLARVVLAESGVLIVNPGSVGWPAFSGDIPYPHAIEAGSPHARYALVEQTGGQWDVTLRAVSYDWERAAGIALANGRPDVAHCLVSGHVG
ncbi:MAG: metallophosphatase family protein [Propionibacteriaceae bacterium]|nr:metallophosphatase family protein [Propionibacteriaceae bacterium]